MKAIVKNFELVEINVTTLLKYGFPQTPLFEGKRITAIEVIDVAKTATTPLNKANLNATAMKDAFLTLNVGGKEKVKEFPLSSLIASNNNGLIREFENLVVSATKSFVEFTTTTHFGSSGAESILIGFYFED